MQNGVNGNNYILYVDQLKLNLYSYVYVLCFLRISKTQLSMTLKFHAFIHVRQRPNTEIYLYTYSLIAGPSSRAV